MPAEGRFGMAKRRYGLSRIMRRLKDTSESAFTVAFLPMKLDPLPFGSARSSGIFRWAFFTARGAKLG
jgi:hypothetical protein